MIQQVVNATKKAAYAMKDLAGDAYNSMVGAEFPINNVTETYGQEGFYNWRLFGSPYMLLDDPPLGGVNKTGFLGDWYMSQLRECQILTIKMGVPKYTGNKKRVGVTDYAVATANAVNEGGGVGKSIVDTILAAVTMNASGMDNATRNYIFYNQYEQYIAYVRLLIVSMAAYLEVTDYPIPNLSSGGVKGFTTIGKQDWSTYTTAGHEVKSTMDMIADAYNWATGNRSSFQQMADLAVSATNKGEFTGGTVYDAAGGPPAIIQFVVQPTYATDSFQNSLTKSAAETQADSTYAIGKEVAWLTNVGDTTSIAGAVGGIMNTGASAVQSALNNVSGDATVGILGSSIVGMLRGLSGERMIFPQIYDDSQFSKAANYMTKLVSPQGDNYSYFINIGLPLCYLIPMIAPKTASTNAYKMPFLCQAYVTGQNAMPMAIFQNMSIERGASGAMNKDGLPLEVNVNIAIQDLYSNLAVSAIHDAAQFLSNESLIEYIASYTPIEAWNKAKVNRFLGEIGEVVGQNAFDPQKIADRLKYNLGEYLGNSLRLYGVADAAR